MEHSRSSHMNLAGREPSLAAIRVTSIRQSMMPGLQIATLTCESFDKKLSFRTDTNLLDLPTLTTLQRFQAYGFIVLELPYELRYEYDKSKLMNTVLGRALQRAEALKDLRGEPEMSGGYDENLAKAVLTVLAKAYPEGLTNMQIKHALSEEPSDRSLLTALDALEGDGHISGTGRRSSTSGRHELMIMANVKITGAGRQHLTGTSGSHSSTIIHGDQNINYGNAAAIGTSSTGSITYQSEWSSLENAVDLKLLAAQLDQLRTAYSPAPEFARKHARSAGFIAEAEEHAEEGDGPKTMEALSKVGTYMLDFAKELGTDLAAKVMAKAMGLDS
jgi:hypothetical protein